MSSRIGTMKKAVTSLLLLVQTISTSAGVFMYAEIPNGRIYLYGQCAIKPGVNCACAVANHGSEDDDFMCMNVEPDRIVFKNDRYRYEVPLDAIKTEISEPSSPSPTTGTPTRRVPG
jgi:hypothetical protein